ncbi:hypothetical protein H257_05169 [Aphanomyces astaci]|uniref:Kinesin-like protein n=1 Tax=Aphanomyces astaci TaxID=112090 RepID=W4GUB2_APHAT|nr:hypothetical protein H257_05169 [Aphanomyces astaci]ETV82574.1 hypothetical protein H257_05169 [Aphanomyces astaci]|eukprot:XP_009828243.1 hypothetical protein H257_05169 [Aphanomyces astaci]
MSVAATAERVRVYCRIRPYIAQACPEADDESSTFVTGTSASSRRHVCVTPTSVSTLTFQDNDTKEFGFDRCFADDCSQEAVYEAAAKDLVLSVLDGYNATIMAYGQTGSGKTHTMVGTSLDGGHADAGIIPRCLRDLFEQRRQSPVATTTKGMRQKGLGAQLRASYVQVYCERVFDLLLDPTSSCTNSQNALQIRETDDRGVYIDGVTLRPVSSVQECVALMEQGNANRTVATTAMNAHSSRSHAILTIHVTTSVTTDGGAEDGCDVYRSQLNLVDLAGSERVKKSLVRGVHVNELKAINLSLSALGNCISALSKQQSHVPYRDSKLTRLLQYSLGGNAKTALVLTVNPDASEASECHATLQFGQRAMKVQVMATVNVVPDYKRLVDELQAKLDAQGDRLNEMDMELQTSKQCQAVLQNQLEEARLETSQVKFELQAMAKCKHPLPATPPSDQPHGCGADDDDQQGQPATTTIQEDTTHATAMFEAKVQELVQEHHRELAQLKTRYDQQLVTHKHVANRANQEWHNVEHELSAERTAHLATIAEVRDAKEKLWATERHTTDRVAELSQDKKDLEVQVATTFKLVRAAEASEKLLTDKLHALEAGKAQLEASIDTNFVSRAQVGEMESLYADAIAKLQHRVESLETSKKTTSAAVPARLLPPVRDHPTAKCAVVVDGLIPKKAVPRIGRVVPAGRR